MGTMIQAPQYGVNESRNYQDLVYEIDEYEDNYSEDNKSTITDSDMKNKKNKRCFCLSKKKKKAAAAGAEDDDNYFKTQFSFDKIAETINTVSRLEKKIESTDIIERVIHENRELKELVERQGQMIENLA